MRIAILGAECTGKTTLGQALAASIPPTPAPWRFVPEFLRSWCDQHQRTPRPQEQADIAKLQAASTDLQTASGFSVIADTAPLMTAIYSEVLFQDTSLHANALEHHRTYDLTLVTGLDIPWVADGLQRDGVAVRASVNKKLREMLDVHRLPYSVVYGTGADRTRNALDAIAQHIGAPRPRSEHDTQWKWACDACSDPDCEHRLFSRLLARA